MSKTSHLSDESFNVTQNAGTEAPFSGKYNNFYQKGVYCCICCNASLFSSDSKYDSGSGWPSFCSSIEGALSTKIDTKISVSRTEITCCHCDSHLGHVFNDGSKSTGLRYCVNSVSLLFKKD